MPWPTNTILKSRLRPSGMGDSSSICSDARSARGATACDTAAVYGPPAAGTVSLVNVVARAPAGELAAWLEFALALCDDADALAMSGFRRDLRISSKPDRTLVTHLDQEIEQGIRDRIRAAYPDHGVVGEEYGESGEGGRTRWFVDPIDGTHNFVRGVPLFGTLLAIEHDGELQVGVMSAPALGERWYATRGGGAWAVRGGGADAPRRIRVSGVAAIDDAQLLYGS